MTRRTNLHTLHIVIPSNAEETCEIEKQSWIKSVVSHCWVVKTRCFGGRLLIHRHAGTFWSCVKTVYNGGSLLLWRFLSALSKTYNLTQFSLLLVSCLTKYQPLSHFRKHTMALLQSGQYTALVKWQLTEEWKILRYRWVLLRTL